MTDPITLILTALVAGAATGAGKTAGDAVQDAYKGLKTVLMNKFGGKSDAEMILAKHEEKPDIWKEPLKAELVAVGADQDTQIIEAAQELLKLANPEEAAKGTFNIKTGDVQGIVGQISGGNVNQTFGSK